MFIPFALTTFTYRFHEEFTHASFQYIIYSSHCTVATLVKGIRAGSEGGKLDLERKVI